MPAASCDMHALNTHSLQQHGSSWLDGRLSLGQLMITLLPLAALHRTADTGSPPERALTDAASELARMLRAALDTSSFFTWGLECFFLRRGLGSFSCMGRGCAAVGEGLTGYCHQLSSLELCLAAFSWTHPALSHVACRVACSAWELAAC